MTTVIACAAESSLTDVWGASWTGRRVAVVGLGRSGVAALTLLRQAGCEVRATDSRRGSQVESVRQRLHQQGVERLEIGGHSKRFLDGAELVVVSPGVPESSLPIQWALHQAVPLLSEIELAFSFCRSPIIAVTGTNGKSTAVTLLAQVLQAAGRAAVACGNLGLPFSSVLDRLTPRTIAVVEVSSFQLLLCTRFRPKISVLLNIGTNHLDRHDDPDAYLAAKARMFQCQTPEDWAVLNAADSRIVALANHLHARLVWFGAARANPPTLALADQTLRSLTPGAQAVLQVARLLNVPDPLTWQVIRAFKGLEHRLEPVTTIRGVRWINDSKSTTPDSLLYALAQTRGDVVVIIGGRDKGLEFSTLIEALHDSRVKGIVLIGESRSRLRPLFNGSTIVRESPTLDEAIQVALDLAPPGSTVLFSPACASFDMFSDFEERGRVFKHLVQTLKGAPRALCPTR